MPKIMDRVNRGSSPETRGASTRRLRSAGPGAAAAGAVPAGVQNAIARAVPVGVRDAVVSRQISGGHDWARTPGLALLADLNGYCAGICGDESDWACSCARSRTGPILEELMRELRDLRVDAGGRLVGTSAREDDYPGRSSDHLPDAIVRWTARGPRIAHTIGAAGGADRRGRDWPRWESSVRGLLRGARPRPGGGRRIHPYRGLGRHGPAGAWRGDVARPRVSG